jgi:hypothetical protein
MTVDTLGYSKHLAALGSRVAHTDAAKAAHADPPATAVH